MTEYPISEPENSIISHAVRREFEDLSTPLIKFLNDHMHPHAKIIIDNESCELVEGLTAFRTRRYWKD